MTGYDHGPIRRALAMTAYREYARYRRGMGAVHADRARRAVAAYAARYGVVLPIAL